VHCRVYYAAADSSMTFSFAQVLLYKCFIKKRKELL